MTLTPSFTHLKVSAASDTTQLASNAFTPAVNDVIVVKMETEDFSKSMGAPTDTQGNIYTQRIIATASSECWGVIYTATASAATSNVITSGTWTGAAGWHAMEVEYWPAATCKLAASPAVNSTKNGTGAPSSTLTTAANGSVVTWSNGDWNAIAPGSRAYRSSATEVGIHDKSTGFYVGYFAYQQAATAGSQTFGLTAPTGQAWTLLGVEIQAQSGASFTHTPTDNEGLTDTVALTQAKAPSDAEGLSDATTIDQAKAPSDTEGLTDTIALNQGKSTSDNEALTDTAALTQEKTSSDSLGLTDSVGLTFGRLPSDTAALTDSLVATQDKSTTDTVGLTDSMTLQRTMALSDNSPTTDSMSTAVPNNQSFTDAEGLTDSGQKMTSTGATTDPAGVSDSLVAVMTFNVTFMDAMGVTDVVTLSRTIALSDNAAPTDTAGAIKSGTNNLQIDDTLGLSDANVRFVRAGSTVDVSGLADSLVVSVTSGLSNTLGLTDSLVTNLTSGSGSFSDTVGLSDSLSVVLTRTVTINDSIGVTDGGSSISLGESLSDTSGLSDAVTTLLTSGGQSIADVVGMSDSMTWTVRRNITISDGIAITDAVSTVGGTQPGTIFDQVFNSGRIADILMPSMAVVDLIIWREAMVYKVGVTLGQTLEDVHIDIKRASVNSFSIRWWDDTAHTDPTDLTGKTVVISVGDSRDVPVALWESTNNGNSSVFTLNEAETDIPWTNLAGYVILEESGAESVLLAAYVHMQP